MEALLGATLVDPVEAEEPLVETQVGAVLLELVDASPSAGLYTASNCMLSTSASMSLVRAFCKMRFLTLSLCPYRSKEPPLSCTCLAAMRPSCES